MPRRLHKLALLLLALTLYSSSSNGSGFAAATCPLPFLKVKMDSEIVGRSVKVTYSIINRGDEGIQDMAIRIGLPSLSVADNAKASSSHKSSSQVIQPGSAVYWLNVDLRRRKRLRFTVKTQLKARLCTAQTIYFPALAYLVNPIDGSASCPSAAATINVYVKGRSSKRRHCPATPSPTVAGNTTIPFLPFGMGERCLQAGRQAPFVGRRDLMVAESSMTNAAQEAGDQGHKQPMQQIPELGC